MDQFASPEPLSLGALVLNMLLAFVLSVIVAWYYARFGEALSNRMKLAKLLPILTLITVLVISVIKSSLALSLGLVGALSIVRFRTAVKDPEELLYLFFAIAIGLGMGADQRAVTLVAVFFTVLLLAAELILELGIFNPDLGGDPVLFQHFFWFYSHPAVYIMILPAMGIISELVPVFSRKHIFGYRFIAY